MSRKDVLVDPTGSRPGIDEPRGIVVEVDEDTVGVRQEHSAGTLVRIDWKRDLRTPVRRDFRRSAGFERLLSEKGIGNTTNGRALRAATQLVRVLQGRLLVLQGLPATRTSSSSTAAGRYRGSFDSRDLVDARGPRPAPPPRTRAQARTPRFRAFRDDAVAAIGSLTVDVRSPDEFSGKLLVASRT